MVSEGAPSSGSSSISQRDGNYYAGDDGDDGGTIAIREAGPAATSLAELAARAGRSVDCFVDAGHLQAVAAAMASDKRLIALKGRGAKLRCITEITRDNMHHCKEVTRAFDLYHLDSLQGNFVVIDGAEYAGLVEVHVGDDDDDDGDNGSGAAGAKKEKKSLLLRATAPSFVRGQQFLFNSAMGRAVPAQQRLHEIARGAAASEFMEAIRDPRRIREVIFEAIGLANFEIRILFSTRNSFFMAEREGMLDALAAMSGKGVAIKVLVMKDDAVREMSEAKLKKGPQYGDIQINYLQQFLPTRITTFIIDQARSLVVEVNDDTKESFTDAVGLATYSNSESTVFSNTSMFESLWIQSELDKQSQVKQAYFKMFKGFKLKDEVYSRRWSFARGEEDGNSSGSGGKAASEDKEEGGPKQ